MLFFLVRRAMVIVEDRRRHAFVVNLDMAAPVEEPPEDEGRRLYYIPKCYLLVHVLYPFSCFSFGCAVDVIIREIPR